MTESEFDSEVMSLIQDLDLVEIGTPEYRAWLAVWAASHYTRYWFCERWRAAMDEKRRQRMKLQRELYKRNKPYSRYVYASYCDK